MSKREKDFEFDLSGVKRYEVAEYVGHRHQILQADARELSATHEDDTVDIPITVVRENPDN